MVVAGLAIGLALNIRTDAALAMPPLALWALATFRRPYLALFCLTVGLAPGVLTAAALNLAKFGIFSPVTYGRQGTTGGATSLSYYAPLYPAAALFARAAFPVRRANCAIAHAA